MSKPESDDELAALRARVQQLDGELQRDRALARASFEAIAIHDQGIIVAANEVFATTFGFGRPEDCVGANLLELAAPESRDLVTRNVLTNNPVPYEAVALRRDGSRFIGEVWGRPTTFRGRVVRVTGFRDITDRRRAEHDLALCRASLASASDAILWIDRGGRIRYANEAAAERLGYTPDEISKLTIFDIDPQTTPESWPTRIERLKTCGRVIVEATHRRKGGRTIPVELGATYLVAEGEELVVVVARDLSERRRLEAQFRQAQKMEAVGQLAGGIAHDFNNLLAVLAMQIGLLADAEPGEGRRAMAADMRATIDRGAALARQLLLFSRRQAMKTERHDLNVLVSNLTKLLRRLLGERITLVTDLGPVPLWIEGDSGMLEQVIMNLCVNARDAMPDGGRLVVAAREVTLTEGEAARAVGGRSERFAHLEVTDSGSGMEPEVVERAFEPFFTTKPAGKGTGLGLATAHGIVAQHDGFMRVESEVGTGSTLHVYLPLVAEGDARADAAEHHAAPGQRGRILFVEDDSALGTVTARSLRELGYDVVLTTNADDALIIWERERGTFDLVLSDMIMPGSMSGLALCRKLCEQDERLRAIILSGYSLELVADDEIAGDRIERLTKPVHLATLAAAMREALAGRGARPT